MQDSIGFAWGGSAGWKSLDIDLGSAQNFDRMVVWPSYPEKVPRVWKIKARNSTTSEWTPVKSYDEDRCRSTLPDGTPVSTWTRWDMPRCGQDFTFTNTSARYVRYSFNDQTLLERGNGILTEVEIFQSGRLIVPASLDFGVQPKGSKTSRSIKVSVPPWFTACDAGANSVG
jgi:hypothetical protein